MAPADEFDPVEHATTSQAARTEPVVLGESEETDGTKLIPKNHTQTLTQRLNPSLTLENSGSVARDHLALERTFLAYMRTSLTIAGTGVGACTLIRHLIKLFLNFYSAALVQLFTISSGSNEQLRKFTHPLGATVIVIGMLTLLTGVYT